MNETGEISPLVIGLANHAISAKVVDLDQFRTKGLVVDTNFIIEVKLSEDYRGDGTLVPFK